jgi:hypothetical protein
VLLLLLLLPSKVEPLPRIYSLAMHEAIASKAAAQPLVLLDGHFPRRGR